MYLQDQIELSTKQAEASSVYAKSMGSRIVSTMQTMGSSRVGGNFEWAKHYRQYKAYRERAYAAIHPLVSRIARQGFRIGLEPKRKDSRSGSARDMMQKAFGAQLGIDRHDDSKSIDFFCDGKQKRLIKAFAPDKIQKAFDTRGMEVLQWHPFNDWIDAPNSYQQREHFIGCIAASNFITGFSLTYVEIEKMASQSGMNRLSDNMRVNFTYFPSHWCEPQHRTKDGIPKPFAYWEITPRHGVDTTEIDGTDLIYIYQEDPEDPLATLAPLQANAKAVAASGKISDAHYHSMENSLNPSWAIIAGDLPRPDGSMIPMRLTKAQRDRIRMAVKAATAGAGKHGEPVVFDALVKDMKKLNDGTDLDYLQGEKMVSSHIREGVGTNEVVSGQVQNANRAGSVVAQSVVFEMTINPQLNAIGNAFNKFFSPLLSTEEYKVHIWMDEAVAKDVEMRMRRAQVFGDCMTEAEVRHFIATGEIDLDPDIEGVADRLRSQVKRDESKRDESKQSTGGGFE
jgi:phage portal protein BeeE